MISDSRLRVARSDDLWPEVYYMGNELCWEDSERVVKGGVRSVSAAFRKFHIHKQHFWRMRACEGCFWFVLGFGLCLVAALWFCVLPVFLLFVVFLFPFTSRTMSRLRAMYMDQGRFVLPLFGLCDLTTDTVLMISSAKEKKHSWIVDVYVHT